ncbi:protein lethal(2)essential for life-like [Vespula squamosa]|uniref:Protein lethal(2)essential for life-like n=1 Tax=Vespula squamosa TaxID=30214 RepID=A0ABD2BAF1_VESSQ
MDLKRLKRRRQKQNRLFDLLNNRQKKLCLCFQYCFQGSFQRVGEFELPNRYLLQHYHLYDRSVTNKISDTSIIEADKNKFQITLNVQQFVSDEVNVKMVEKNVMLYFILSSDGVLTIVTSKKISELKEKDQNCI